MVYYVENVVKLIIGNLFVDLVNGNNLFKEESWFLKNLFI